MANKFVRNITNVRNIEKQELVTNNQNDLLSDKNHAYIRNNNEYHPLTDNVKTINGMEVDKDNNKNAVSIAVTENGGEVPFKVDGQKLTFDTGKQVKKVNTVDPNANGEIELGINMNGKKVETTEQDNFVTFELGKVVQTINGQEPDANGNVSVSGSQAKIAVVENQHVANSAQWAVRVNKVLNNPQIIVTKYIDEHKHEIDADRIQVYNGEGTSQIVINLEDDIRSLCGMYELLLINNDYPEGGIYVTNPVYNNPNMTPYVNGILPGVNSDFAISFSTNAMNELINSGAFNFWIGADKLTIEQVTELDHDLPTLSGGQNYMRLEYNNRTLWATVVTKLP